MFYILQKMKLTGTAVVDRFCFFTLTTALLLWSRVHNLVYIFILPQSLSPQMQLSLPWVQQCVACLTWVVGTQSWCWGTSSAMPSVHDGWGVACKVKCQKKRNMSS